MVGGEGGILPASLGQCRPSGLYLFFLYLGEQSTLAQELCPPPILQVRISTHIGLPFSFQLGQNVFVEDKSAAGGYIAESKYMADSEIRYKLS